jgi:hypothetical protein
METQTTTSTPKTKRVRKRSLAIQLECALRDAEAAATADISTQKLIQTRLVVLTTMQARERHDKLKRALAENERLNAENEGLRQDLQQALAAKATRPLTAVEIALQKYQQEKQIGGAS